MKWKVNVLNYTYNEILRPLYHFWWENAGAFKMSNKIPFLCLIAFDFSQASISIIEKSFLRSIFRCLSEIEKRNHVFSVQFGLQANFHIRCGYCGVCVFLRKRIWCGSRCYFWKSQQRGEKDHNLSAVSYITNIGLFS